ncbi:MAG: phytanoyl-CoA dioxygenase family protein [Rhodoferax sp.]|nr:phytanoyl-CoA dioxygenase family protein [Rhodoferax sp.]
MAGPRLPAEVDRAAFDQAGFAFPIPVLDPEATDRYLKRYLEFRERHGPRLQSLPPNQHWQIHSDTHFAFRWIDELTREPAVLDAVERILGPDILVWNTAWFVKMPGDKTFVSLHQDGAYWGLEPMEVLTAWVALTPATPENGCMRVLPGTHRRPALPQSDTFHPDNALSRGQEIAVPVDESAAIDMALAPGQMSMHHLWIVHGSRANQTSVPRIGLAIRYVSPRVRHSSGNRPWAMLVRGQDTWGHFHLTDRPDGNDGYAGEGFHGDIQRRVHEAIAQARQASG